MSEKRTDLSDRFLQFSTRVLLLVDGFPNTFAARIIADQLARSATSVGANYEEARGAQSRTDFSYKLQVAFKEIREARYWLCLVESVGVTTSEPVKQIIDEATQLRAILGKAVATSRGKSKS